jgi:predicted 3-demethylubiquinone-9 3-methyltransferase (glyoxalase superfamily)
MFVGEVCGRAEEAMHFYASVFHKTKIGDITRYGQDEEPDKEGTIKHAAFMLEGQGFAAMDSAYKHSFAFNEAISFMVHCETQEEIDAYWEKLSKGGDPKAQQCGWLKDQFGVSWQIVPTILAEMLQSPDKDKVERVTTAFLKMKKFDMDTLQRAYEGK